MAIPGGQKSYSLAVDTYTHNSGVWQTDIARRRRAGKK